MTDAGLKADIDSIAKDGFGGLEINAFPLPQGVGSEFKWGTKAWNHLIKVAAGQAGKDGLTLDLANGPQWPIAMPDVDSADNAASLYEMTYGSSVLQPGHSYSGIVPARRTIHSVGTPKLDAVLAYRMTGPRTLDPSSVVDLLARTHLDAADNTQSTVRFTAPPGADRWVLFTFWEQPAAQKVDGYYVVDHFSAAGAKASDDYWERIGLPALGKNLRYLRSIFDDSLEYRVAMEWTRGMRRAFKHQHGYDITPYLPFVGVSTTYPPNDIPGYQSTDGHLSEKIEYDYRETLTTLYTDSFLRPMEQLAERHGLTVRAQVAYNKPMQIETSALAVGIPETESLGRESIDMQRYMAGAVHLAGKKLYSIEASAEFGNNYGQSLRDILWWLKRAWAAGVNIQRLHGESYSGQFDGRGNVRGHLPGQSWPGYSAFKLLVSNNWTRQTSPAALREVLTYISRINFIMQKKAKVDVAIYDDSPDIYNNKSVKHGDGEAVYPDGGDLSAYGYSYDFVSPALLELPQAAASHGRIDPEGPAYQALIIHGERAMTMPVVQRLEQLASAGVKILFVGDTPDRNASYADQLREHSDADIRAAISDLLRLPSVATVSAYAEVPATLHRLGVFPDAEPAAPADILSQHRVDANGDYYYFYNYNEVSNSDAVALFHPPHGTSYPDLGKSRLVSKTTRYSLVGTGRPYWLDAWTGQITPIPQFTRSNGRVNVTIHLVGDQAAMLVIMTNAQALRNGVVPASVWSTNSDVPYGELAYANDRTLAVKASRPGSYRIRLNTGRTAIARVSAVQQPYRVDNWNLRIASIGPPSNGSTLFQDSSWQELGPFHPTPLKPWKDLGHSLARVSGIGIYTTTFTLDHGWNQGGSAYVDLGEVNGYFSVSVNGHELPPHNQVSSLIDLGSFAESGSNILTVRVATTLYNRVVRAGKPYGLEGTNGVIKMIPYRFLPVP